MNSADNHRIVILERTVLELMKHIRIISAQPPNTAQLKQAFEYEYEEDDGTRVSVCVDLSVYNNEPRCDLGVTHIYPPFMRNR